MGNQKTYAEKSAEPVAARVASEERRACQTAPLWPMNVPILTRVSKLMDFGIGMSGPVASDAVSQHRIVVFASGDEVVLVIVQD